MPIVSARYTNVENTEVAAVDNQGRTWFNRVDNQSGMWLEYIKDGGTIDPFIPPVVPTNDVIDKETLNAIMSEPGSFVRAIVEIQFLQIKGIIPVDPNITPKQYKDLVELHMRTRP